MEGINVYSYIVSLFQDVAKIFSQGLLNALVGVLKIDALMTAIGMIVIIIFAIRKLQDNDFFTLKTAIAICLMLGYIGFFNWAISNPTEYYEGVSFLLEYPSNTLSEKILALTANISTSGSSGFNGGIDVLIQQALTNASALMQAANIKIGFTGISGNILNVLLAIIYYLCNLIFTILVVFIILVAVLQVMIWKSLSIIFLLFMFLPQTRGMVGKYVLFVITLTMYKPMVLTVAFFNTSISKYIDGNMPPKKAFESGEDLFTVLVNNQEQTSSISGYICLGIIGCFICVFLVKQVPEFLSNIIGTSTSMGKGMAAAAAGAMGAAAGLIGGGAAGMVMGQAKSAYQGAGGGVGGLASATAALATGGVGGAVGKAASWAASKMSGEQKNLGMGNAINNAMNKSKAGSMANSAVAKGISAGTNLVRGIGGGKKK